MRATFTQDQLDLAATVRALTEGGREQARATYSASWDAPPSDRALLEDFSVLGVPESAGGVGSGLVDLAVAIEVIGRSLSPSRFPTHAAAIQLLVDSGIDLAPALSGEAVWTVALDEPDGAGWSALAARADEPRLKTLVPHASGAEAAAVLGSDGVWLAEIGKATPRESFDPSWPLSDVVPAGGTAAAVGTGAHRAALVAAAQLCGLAQGAIDLGAEYARGRTQFGRVIGSFQGVAFQLVDAAVARKAAWDLTIHAAWALDRGRPEAPAQAHAAKAAAGKAAIFAAERCIQVHGGMGITYEADPHLFLRRAFVLDAWLGSGAWHRRQVGAARIAARVKA